MIPQPKPSKFWARPLRFVIGFPVHLIMTLLPFSTTTLIVPTPPKIRLPLASDPGMPQRPASWSTVAALELADASKRADPGARDGPVALSAQAVSAPTTNSAETTRMSDIADLRLDRESVTAGAVT